MLGLGTIGRVISGAVRGGAAALTPQASGDQVYDALNPRGRRRTASASASRPEDQLGTQSRRDGINANSLDVWRNMSLLAWMIRRTLDYCCLWDFQPMTPDDGLNRDLRLIMERDCQAPNIDYVGRQDWDDLRRIGEASKILVGDSFYIPLSEGTLQLLEGTLCRNPERIATGETWINGARANGRGRIVEWNFAEQVPDNVGGWNANDRRIKARNVWQHVQYDARPNAYRGTSTVQTILNECRDIYETFDHARAKVKLDQIFGVAIYANPDDEDDIGKRVDEDGKEADNDTSTDEEHYDFGYGPVVFNRETGEKVELLTSDHPGANTQDFLRLCIALAMKALDLPYNFFDEAHTNFFGSRAAWNLYERSCWPRRATQLRLHHRMTRWRLWQWCLPVELGGTGEIILPASMRIEDMRYRWISRGLPWWKPDEELSTALAAAACGLKTMQGICDENNLGNYEENLAQLRREREQAARHGFVLNFNPAKLAAVLMSDDGKGLAA